MPDGLRVYFDHELSLYRRALTDGDYRQAWKHLERSHVIAQPWAVEHTSVHWLMLRFGFKIKDRKEIVGQIPRLIVGGVKSFVGKIPVGNTGGSNVPPLRRMDVPSDLAAIMKPFLR